ncbi:MAG: hypothetical protein HQ546_08225, partial [Planctomycetes bacterium]|nr:hypothetical protein [Planctomycetota bacterium]
TGNAGGTIKGSIICYGDTELAIWGSSFVRIDQSECNTVPAGFKHPVILVPLAETYAE